jgi:hypothetical protein
MRSSDQGQGAPLFNRSGKPLPYASFGASVPGFVRTLAGRVMHLCGRQIECLAHAEAGARVRLLGCGPGRGGFGADKDLREFERVVCFREDQGCGASDVQFR